MTRITAILAIFLTLAPTVAMANCVTYTIMSGNGQMRFCTTCCYGGHCTTNCV